MRDWQVQRRKRTRHLIELGGLVTKADLVELTDDDRAALYGAFLTVAAKLRGPDGARALVLLTCSPDCYHSEVESRSFMIDV